MISHRTRISVADLSISFFGYANGVMAGINILRNYVSVTPVNHYDADI